jgi:hypothetical protein
MYVHPAKSPVLEGRTRSPFGSYSLRNRLRLRPQPRLAITHRNSLRLQHSTQAGPRVGASALGAAEAEAEVPDTPDACTAEVRDSNSSPEARATDAFPGRQQGLQLCLAAGLTQPQRPDGRSQAGDELVLALSRLQIGLLGVAPHDSWSTAAAIASTLECEPPKS